MPLSIRILEGIEDQLLELNKDLKFSEIESEQEQTVQAADVNQVINCFTFTDNIILNNKTIGRIRVFQQNEEYNVKDNGKDQTTVQTKDRLQVLITIK